MTTLAWLGAYLLIAGALLLTVEALMTAALLRRIRRRAADLRRVYAGAQRDLDIDLARFQMLARERREASRPLRRAWRWYRHPLTQAWRTSRRRRRGQAEA